MSAHRAPQDSATLIARYATARGVDTAHATRAFLALGIPGPDFLEGYIETDRAEYAGRHVERELVAS